MTAFGPYAGCESVDFGSLADEGLFLIHGPTGSGKTFLLDALSFALYGEVTGERAVASLRSDHASPTAEPSVTLELDAQGERWLIERVPAHQRAGPRRDRAVPKPAKAQLSQSVAGAWVPVASGVREVGLRIHDLIGLDAKQFRQVILLPQGGFEKVLRASSETREELLKTLFDSVLFEHVSLHLDRQAKDATTSLGDADRALAQTRSQAFERSLEVVGAGVDDAGSTAPDDQVGLDHLAARLRAAADAQAVLADDAEQALGAARHRVGALTTLASRIERRDMLLARRAQLARDEPTVAARRARLRQAAAAESLRPLLEQLDDAHRAVSSTVATLGRAVEHAGELRTTSPIRLPDPIAPLLAPHSSGAVGPGLDLSLLEPAQHALVTRRTELQALGAVADHHHLLVAEADQYDERADALDRQVTTAQVEVTRLHTRREATRSAHAAAAGAAARLDGLEVDACASRARADAASLLDGATEMVEVRRGEHLDADRSLQDHRTALNDRRQIYLDGIAAVLAGHLEDGDPCLVCGSSDHPRPALPGAGAVTADDIADAEARVEHAHRCERLAADHVHAAQEALHLLETRAGGAAADPGAAVATAEAAAALVADTAAEAATHVPLDAELTRIDHELADREELIGRAGPDAAAARAAAVSARRQADACVAQLADTLDPGVALDAALDVLDTLADALRNLAAAHAGHVVARRTAADVGERLTDALAESSFGAVADAMAAVLTDAQRADLERRIADHDEATIAVGAGLDLPELSDLPLQAGEVTDATETVRAAERTAQSARAHGNRLGDAADAVAALAERHRSGDVHIAEQRQQVQVLHQVADQCMGRNDDKVSLQRWVLATYLTEICELATVRLLAMSAHRYSLRVRRGPAGRGAKSGLDLRVFDAHTGEERDVQSLSGGETFQASLALALAVADSVQRHAGGVHLDALFVDEGFGSLDSSSLDLAMDELDQLRSGGRMVGIISHVAGLRERIGVGIEVVGSPRGSTIRVGELTAG